MPDPIVNIAWSVFLASVCLLSQARADFSAVFDGKVPAVDSTLIGAGGWSPRLATPTPDLDSARVVKVRWAGYRPAAMLKGANLRNDFAPPTGATVDFKIELALTFAEGGPPGRSFRLGFYPAPFGEIFFDQGPEGGLGFGADGSGKGGTVVLTKKEIRLNDFYTLEGTADYKSGTCDLKIEGRKRDGSPFIHRAKQVPFDAGKKPPGMVYLITGGNITAYLGSLTVSAGR